MVHRLGGRTRTLIEMGGHFVMTRLAWPGSSDEFVVDTFGPASANRLIVQTFRLPTLPLAGVTQKNRLAY